MAMECQRANTGMNVPVFLICGGMSALRGVGATRLGRRVNCRGNRPCKRGCWMAMECQRENAGMNVPVFLIIRLAF